MTIVIPKALKKWDVLFLILLIGISYLYSYQTILFLRPSSSHQWRQCDCLSLTLNYYKEGMHFFRPSINLCLLPKKSCNTSTSECPWIYYLVACLWKIFGYHEFIYRLLNILIAYTGLYALFNIVKTILNDGAWALMISLLLFTSPIYAFYTNNFIVDISALNIALIAWFFFVNYYKTRRLLFFNISIFFFLLAGLTKISGLYSFIPLIILYLWELFGKNKAHRIFSYLFKQGLSILFLIVIICSWTIYSIHYNNTYTGSVFSTTILPIWKLIPSQVHIILVKFYNNLLPQYFSSSIIFLSLALFFVILINYKKINPFYYYFLIMLFAGCILYFLLWYMVFNVHDYYLINFLIYIPFVFLVFLIFLKENYSTFFYSIRFKIFFACILLFNIYYCFVQVNIRYAPTYHLVRESFIIDEQTTNFWNWAHWNYESYEKAFETVTPYLRSLGISRNDMVISIPDKSTNTSLYLMDVKGYTDYGGGVRDTGSMNCDIRSGAAYLIISNPSLLDSAWVQPYLKNKIGSYKNITIYALKRL